MREEEAAPPGEWLRDELLAPVAHRHLGFAPDAAFLPVPAWDPTLLMTLFRERLLARLLDRHAISQELVRRLLVWGHRGFSAPPEPDTTMATAARRPGVVALQAGRG